MRLPSLLALLPFLFVLRAEPYTLTVELKGFASDAGLAAVALHSDAKAFPTKEDKAVAKQRVPIGSGKATVVFKGLAAGDYAVAAYHDKNGNSKLDANFIGIPKEPIGVSNDAKGKMGPPKFKDAQFELNADKTITVTIQ